MARIRVRGEEIRRFIMENVGAHPRDVAGKAATRFRISRQAVNKHLQRLAKEGCLTETGKTRNREYALMPLTDWQEEFPLVGGLEEDVIWERHVSAALGQLPENVSDIWQYAFTEMLNNARDHSGGSRILVMIRKTAVTTEMAICDDGVGIFRKVQAAFNLLDERHAVLELAKGKLTTDPKNHTGEGIFFTSRMVDTFNIFSGGVTFMHEFGQSEDWIFERTDQQVGTIVYLKLNNHTARTQTKIFDKFSAAEDYGFNKTVVPVKMAQYGNDKLVSRSQARRVLARVELFKKVIFDFSEVPIIGQAFADEIFRVFAFQHQEIELVAIRANSVVMRMILRAKSVRGEPEFRYEQLQLIPVSDPHSHRR
jgi:biotin operon repressor/anti-sigma regulatory factor (Ser/Thr protein kinase)